MEILQNFLLKLKLISLYYRLLIIPSLLLTASMLIFGLPMEPILAVKIFFITLIFLENRFLSAKDRFLFYKNFGISTRFMAISIFLFDFIFSVLIFKIFNAAV